MRPLAMPDYAKLSDHLAESELRPSAAEAHGMLCGLICSRAREPEETWIREVLGVADPGDLLAQEARGALRFVAEYTREEIDGPGLGFTLLLPGEDRPLAERALGLYDWTRGFLYGLGIAGVKEEDLSEQTREVFEDFTKLTRLDLNALGESEENEEALTELTEFVWVAAMLVYEEFRGAEGQSL